MKINLSFIGRTVVAVSALLTGVSASAYTHNFDTVPDDPMHSLIYTLPNGLKVFMSVNRDQPRIQTNIAVRVGGKNDPAETTGLAHYFEHLMFKGTQNFGTRDYAAEKPLLDQIEELFEQYRSTTDSTERAKIYHVIDSVSYQASLLAIPNEYDKLMAGIGANGSNAYTGYDATCYVEDIPSNHIEEWAIVQADRFKNPVLRGFHTELETIYEEKNMSLTRDNSKAFDAIFAELFPNHPYGRQTILGSQQHLKNPSIRNVRLYHDKWYVPNNMAICVAGDFDPDEMVDIVEKYFGDMKPNESLKYLEVVPEAPITSPIFRKVNGLDSEFEMLAWRLPASKDRDMTALTVLNQILNNGNTGLIDKNINLSQKALGAYSFIYNLADQSAMILGGRPGQGQSLEDVRALLLEQVQALREGQFDQALIDAIITNMKLDLQKGLESNETRVDNFVDAFTNGQTWAESVASLKELENITKDDIVRVANKYLGPNNYVAIDKVTGEDTSIQKIGKAALTPIATNREYSSQFLTDVLSRPVKPIEPVFVDYDKDLTKTTAKNGEVEVLYTRNSTNDLFTLIYIYEYGYGADPRLTNASSFLDLIGTTDKSVTQIKDEFYALGCTFYVSVGLRRSYVVISGLDENAEKAVKLAENLLSDANPDAEVWTRLVDRFEKSRDDRKKNQMANFSALRSWMTYGGNPDSIPSLALQQTIEEMRATNPAEITDAISKLNTHRHRAVYYGPRSKEEAVSLIDNNHKTPAKLSDVPESPNFRPTIPTETIIYVAPYDSEQLYMAQFANRGKEYDPKFSPTMDIYNEYFGGSMNSIVFQEMRESRSLAYTAWAAMNEPGRANEPYVYSTMIATQNDKLGDAIQAFDLIINEMPESEPAFALAKDGTDARIRTSRTIKDGIAWSYLNALDHGVNYDTNRDLFNLLQTATLDDIVKFQKENVKGNTYNYAILGRIEDLDMDMLNSLGRVVILTPEQIFGY